MTQARREKFLCYPGYNKITFGTGPKGSKRRQPEDTLTGVSIAVLFPGKQQRQGAQPGIIPD
ncbi:hypothetical protein KDC22_09470 [Paenibacillus tritici]|uniref:hypothetical protein n=1 Tax=Paenibacillus tritici TaxID=1873425 RepID=UPI001BA6D36F|nr:hypothetical protein [Paenibacillus tritici]QUL56684.1 hypothetical protein KDC22_09470 [Paenibacillus tritici]